MASLGKGDDLLLLHGFPETLQSWCAVAPQLADRFRVHAFDWPSYGGSVRPEGFDDTPRRYAGVLREVVRGLRRPHLVASDIGMLPALLVALEQPDSVARVVAMSGQAFFRPQHTAWELGAMRMPVLGELLVHGFGRRAIRSALRRGFYRPPTLPPEVVSEFLALASRPESRRAALRYFRAFRNDLLAFEERVKDFTAPVMVVWGACDAYIRLPLGEELHRRLPGSRFEVLQETGHFLHLERPTELARLVRDFCG